MNTVHVMIAKYKSTPMKSEDSKLTLSDFKYGLALLWVVVQIVNHDHEAALQSYCNIVAHADNVTTFGNLQLLRNDEHIYKRPHFPNFNTSTNAYRKDTIAIQGKIQMYGAACFENDQLLLVHHPLPKFNNVEVKSFQDLERYRDQQRFTCDKISQAVKRFNV